MRSTGAKDELHRMVDALPKRELTAARRFLEFLLSKAAGKDPWKKFLTNPPVDDEPLDEEEIKAIEEAEKDISDGQVKPWEQVKRENENSPLLHNK